MNPAVKELWLKALRRRKNAYQQGHGRLRDGDKYCCLGVLCDVYRQEQGGPDWQSHEFGDTGYPTTINSVHEQREVTVVETATLPHEVRDWAGLGSVDPQVEYKGETLDLSELNDGEEDVRAPLTFRQIANLIEENL